MIRSPLLESMAGIDHGFGTRSDERPANVVTAGQVHGTEILEVGEIALKEAQGYDILITSRPGIAVAVKTADCLPILIAEPSLGAVAAVHAGWKGTLKRVTERAVEALLEMGGEVQNLIAVLGPNMKGPCFEVEGDVQKAFEREFLDWPILTKKNERKWMLDIAETNRRQLLDLGMKAAQIDRIDLCTHCRTDIFHSYRRDGTGAGRMVNFIKILPPIN